jgi:hypothetical protein
MDQPVDRGWRDEGVAARTFLVVAALFASLFFALAACIPAGLMLRWLVA